MSDGYEIDRQEGFTGAAKRAPWVQKFAAWPVRYKGGWLWRVAYQEKRYSAFGIHQREIEVL